MAIISLQRRARELGRIRIGRVVRSGNGKTRPEKLDRFRITSASRPLLTKVADLYGGTVTAWTPQNGGAEQWEVVTDATRLPVLVGPQPLTQYFELWSGGGCARRCDGETELLTNAACLCDVDPAERECKPTTRLNVILRDVEGIGVFRLESHGYYAAVELPDVAAFLAQTRGYVAAHLGLEERVVKRDGATHRFMVPTIEVDVTPAQLLAGHVTVAGLGPGEQGELTTGAPAALPAGTPVTLDVDSVRAAIGAADSLEVLRALWPEAKASGLESEARQRADQLGRRDEGVVLDDPDLVWPLVLQAVPEDWTTEHVEREFAAVIGSEVENATAAEMRRFLEHLAPTDAQRDES